MAINLEHPWKELVLDGVGEPRFLIVGDELCTNGDFEIDLSDWLNTSSYGTRVANTTTHYGDYVMQVSDDVADAQGYVYYTVALTPNASGRKFVFTLVYKNADDGVRAFSIRTGTGSSVIVNDLVATQNWQSFTFVQEFGLTSDTILYYEIYPCLHSLGNAGIGSILVDNTGIREVSKDYVFPCPKVFHQIFERELQAKNILLNGTIKKYIKGWRYKGRLGYEYLGKSFEYIRRELAQYVGDLIFFPHRDIDNSILVAWDGDYAQKYFKDRYIGHEGIIPLEGVQLVGNLISAPEFGGINVEDQMLIS